MSTPITNETRIAPWPENPAYWSTGGKPVMLLGGSIEDNLFQIKEIEDELDQIAAAGGNYVRCTLSCRDEGNVWPFARGADGRYDLTQWDEEYWRRFRTFLELTQVRGIVVQIELWATFDFYKTDSCWAASPWNPKNNTNYSCDESNLPHTITTHPTRCQNPFFWSVPAEHDNMTLLAHQERFVSEILRHTLPRPHVLYCMDNETCVTPEWGWYWARFVQEKAKAAGVDVYCTEMWDDHDLAGRQHQNTYAHPECYQFVEVSQNNWQVHEQHYLNLIAHRERVYARRGVCPLSCVKVYGNRDYQYGSTRDGIERYWRNIFGGVASTRFHRPLSGLGSTERALRHMKSARLFCNHFPLFVSEPRPDLLARRAPNESFCLAAKDTALALWFPDGGASTVNCEAVGLSGDLHLRWLDCEIGALSAPETVSAETALLLSCPADQGYWAALLTRA